MKHVFRFLASMKQEWKQLHPTRWLDSEEWCKICLIQNFIWENLNYAIKEQVKRYFFQIASCFNRRFIFI